MSSCFPPIPSFDPQNNLEMEASWYYHLHFKMRKLRLRDIKYLPKVVLTQVLSDSHVHVLPRPTSLLWEGTIIISHDGKPSPNFFRPKMPPILLSLTSLTCNYCCGNLSMGYAATRWQKILWFHGELQIFTITMGVKCLSHYNQNDSSLKNS